MAAELERISGPTPNGGAYAILQTRPDGSREIAEYDARGRQVARTYVAPRPTGKLPQESGR